jgi:ADP-heptose:LPS heptosyltransferase
LIGAGTNPKNYPYWRELIQLLKQTRPDMPIVQIGIAEEEQLVDDFKVNLPLSELKNLVMQCKTWIAVDSFFQHFCWDLGKKGVVIFSQSDPNIFGHIENLNLLKSRSYLREQQFWLWSQATYNPDAYVSPAIVLQNVGKLL